MDATGSPYQIQIYEAAGHRFERDLASAADQSAATDAWQRTLSFLGEYLKP